MNMENTDIHIPTYIIMNTKESSDNNMKNSINNIVNYNMNNSQDINSLFFMLQISDPLFPIGSYTQSFGLETYVQKGIVHNTETSKQYVESYLQNNFLYNDLLAVKLAYEYAKESSNDEAKKGTDGEPKKGLNKEVISKVLQKIISLDNLISASKSPYELRTGSEKLGKRFLKIVEQVLKKNIIFKSYMEEIKNGKTAGNYSLIYGITASLLNIDKVNALSAFTYTSSSAIVNNCAKLVPISQSDGQTILFGLHPIYNRILRIINNLDEDDLGLCCFGFDLKSMQHERLYSRIYIS